MVVMLWIFAIGWHVTNKNVNVSVYLHLMLISSRLLIGRAIHYCHVTAVCQHHAG